MTKYDNISYIVLLNDDSADQFWKKISSPQKNKLQLCAYLNYKVDISPRSSLFYVSWMGVVVEPYIWASPWWCFLYRSSSSLPGMLEPLLSGDEAMQAFLPAIESLSCNLATTFRHATVLCTKRIHVSLSRSARG